MGAEQGLTGEGRARLFRIEISRQTQVMTLQQRGWLSRELLRIGEHLGLRGPDIDKLNTASLAESRDYDMPSPFVPHGISVIVNAPAVFRYTAAGAPVRHLEAAACLGADAHGATPDDAGEVVATRIVDLMRATEMPNGLGGVGFGAGDVGPLARSAERQRRAIGNAPRDTNLTDIEHIYQGALSYW